MEIRNDNLKPTNSKAEQHTEKHKAVKELFGKEEETRKSFKLPFDKRSFLIALGVAGAVGAVAYYFNRPAYNTGSNVDVVAIVKKVNEENKKQTQEIVNQLAKQVNQLTLAVKQLAEKEQKAKAEQKKAEQKQVEELKKKLKALEEKEKLKRELEMQRALMKEYLSELKQKETTTATLAVEVEKVEKPLVKKKTTLHRVYIPTGSVVAGRTMHLIPAPVERGALPLPPVLIKLEGDAYTANGFSVPLDDCYMIGKAQGDWNFIGGREYARAEVQLTKLVCVLGNGKVVEKKINAYVVDKQTGMEGLLGKKQDLSGEQILRYTAVNTLSAFFSGLADSATETVTNNDGYTIEKITKPAKYALFSALHQSWSEYTQFYKERLKKVNPVVLVPANRELEVVFLSGVDLGVTDRELLKWGL